ncbi:WXG100 family type VII secretion target [Actinoplanes friuliensis]|uniref:WXG100 family type VII secretion target n=1 Tax=Actinoplanes friuliensis TaxID=196914 RepID=UPI0005A2CEDB
MTMPVVQTTEPGMQAAAQEFSARATEFTGHLQSVNSEMATLQSTWTGTASNGFNQAMDNWEASFQKVINELINIMEVMGVNTKGYAQAEDTAASSAQSFASALPGI